MRDDEIRVDQNHSEYQKYIMVVAIRRVDNKVLKLTLGYVS